MNTYLGIEFGSTRIKAVAINEQHVPVFSGNYQWTSDLKNGIWTYDLDEAWIGLKTALKDMEDRESISMMGISGMMHGYLAFDEDWNLLVPFRTWQNTITEIASRELTALFGFNIPQRWSVAHLYQAVLNNEEHIHRIAHITTLAGYIHFRLTGVNAVGIGEASGIFPVDSETLSYDKRMVEKFNEVISKYQLPWKVEQVLPSVLVAGDDAGSLTEEGAKLLEWLLPAHIPFAAPEGDAGTGMVATNAVAARTGNVSAGTSIFAMIVLEKLLKNVYEEIDIVATPAGRPVAMVHCNNGTNDSNAWVSVLKEAAVLFGAEPADGDLYTKLYEKSLEGQLDCGGVLVCNYLAGEGITHFNTGRPMIVRTPEAKFTLANFFRAVLYSTMATLKLGMDILARENVPVDSLMGHGGLFKTATVGQRYLAAACNVPVTCMETAGEGGAYGMALLAQYAAKKADGETLESYLKKHVFADTLGVTLDPDLEEVRGFQKYIEKYRELLKVEQAAVDMI